MSKKLTDYIKDPQSVTTDSEVIRKLPEGVSFRESPTHVDERGQLLEMFDERWSWHDEPLKYAYMSTMYPGIVKGWAMHKLHEDRYCILFGHMEVVLYDARPDSSTSGLLTKITLSEYNRRLVNIPAGIWHADHNIGDKEAVFMNFPTEPYDHADPDKYRLPIDTDQIPYSFGNAKGW